MSRPRRSFLVVALSLLGAACGACGASSSAGGVAGAGIKPLSPPIVTGTVLFTNRTTSGFVQRDTEVYDSFGRRRVVPLRTYMERKGFILRPKFVFIDGRTGATMYSESYREEVLYNAQQNTPALSSYFELMDRLVPNFLSALSSQKIRGTRVLLK